MNDKRIRKTKKEIYTNERNIIINDLNVIIKFDDNNGKFLLDDLKNNSELTNKLKQLSEHDLKKFYNSSTWGWYNNIKYKDNNPDVICLLKNIYKNHDYNIFSKSIIHNINNIKKRYTEIYFIKK